ncbi:unnamed protein product [Prorocentrum cordatum]|uniref:Uncharacterized protein n=1 Tax=Prorocentrum cordatum TaxID=2364126 RepID=A0ABN9U8H0_9DINO|nr:unnamed protein product [Polarella glacialis]
MRQPAIRSTLASMFASCTPWLTCKPTTGLPQKAIMEPPVVAHLSHPLDNVGALEARAALDSRSLDDPPEPPLLGWGHAREVDVEAEEEIQLPEDELLEQVHHHVLELQAIGREAVSSPHDPEHAELPVLDEVVLDPQLRAGVAHAQDLTRGVYARDAP